MYVEQYLVKDRHQERLMQAEDLQVSRRISQVRRLRKRQERAERQLLQAWQRVEQLWSLNSAG